MLYVTLLMSPFNTYSYSSDIWRSLLQVMGFQRDGTVFDDEVLAATKIARNKKGNLYMACLAEIVYMIWSQRNVVIFRGKCLPRVNVIKEILYRVAC